MVRQVRMFLEKTPGMNLLRNEGSTVDRSAKALFFIYTPKPFK